MPGAPLNYAALLRALKLRLILRQHQNSAHFGGFISFRNPYSYNCLRAFRQNKSPNPGFNI